MGVVPWLRFPKRSVRFPRRSLLKRLSDGEEVHLSFYCCALLSDDQSDLIGFSDLFGD